MVDEVILYVPIAVDDADDAKTPAILNSPNIYNNPGEIWDVTVNPGPLFAIIMSPLRPVQTLKVIGTISLGILTVFPIDSIDIGNTDIDAVGHGARSPFLIK